MLNELENGTSTERAPSGARRHGKSPPPAQLPMLMTTPVLIQELLKLDVASMTPLEAINKLYEIQEKARNA